jgi:hypothetical protein
MILVDFNLIAIMSLTSWCRKNPNAVLKVDEAASVIVYNLEDYRARFASFGKMVLACDSRSYWRQKYFPHYKYRRKQDRQKPKTTNEDWDVFHAAMDDVKARGPYHVVEVDGAEGDDVIAVLTHKFSPKEDVLILSSDRDFQQLQTHPKVRQYDPQKNVWVDNLDPILTLRQHIIKGDSGDSIPNYLCPDDNIIKGQRNKRINTPILLKLIQEDDYHAFCDTPEKVAYYERNQTLIDFNFIPDDIKQAILTKYSGHIQ